MKLFGGGGQFSEEEVYFRMYLYSNEKEEMSALKLFSVSVHRCKNTHSVIGVRHSGMGRHSVPDVRFRSRRPCSRNTDMI